MPTFPVAAVTLPFGEASPALSLFDPDSMGAESMAGSSSTLRIDDFRNAESSPLQDLVDEAIGVAEELGVVVRRRWLAGAGGGSYWRGGRLRIVLDRQSTEEDQLRSIADALRGDWRLAAAEMSPALVEFFDVRRVA